MAEPRRKIYPICDAPLDRRGYMRAASLRYRNRVEIFKLICEKKSGRYDFCAGARAIRFRVNIASITTTKRL